MRFIPLGVAGGIVGALSAVTGAVPAWAAAARLQWHSPPVITSGQPFQVSSIQSCPALPNPGDQLLIGITVTFPGGAIGNVLPGNADGSWSGSVTFSFIDTPPRASLSADCEDFDGVSATSYATYQARTVRLVQ